MRWVIIYSFFSIIISSCTAEVAREAGKAIKSIDATFQSNKKEKEKIVKQKKLTKIELVGKNEKELVKLLGTPSLTRKDGSIFSMRFNRDDCIAYTFFNSKKNIPEVEYFELRSKEGELLTNKSEINSCLKTVS